MHNSKASIWIVIFFYGISIHAKQIIRMKTDETLEITNDKYPEMSQFYSEMWEFGTSRGGGIRLECEDIRISAESCGEGRFSVSAGDYPQKVCANVKSYNVSSLFESLYVNIDLKSGKGAFKCKVTALSAPDPIVTRQSFIHLQNDKVNTDIHIKTLHREKQQEYIITAAPGRNIFASCKLKHSNYQAKNPCDVFELTLDGKGDSKSYCTSNDKILFHSNDDIMKISFKTGLMVGSGYILCDLSSISGGTDRNHKEVASKVVDASATKNGTKQTS